MKNDKTIVQTQNSELAKPELNVLLVGNNPIEMSAIYNEIHSLQGKVKCLDIAFSKEDVMKKISEMKANCLLLDDNIGALGLKAIIKSVNDLEKEAIAITLLKSHNSQGLILGVQEYVMKENLSAARIYKSLQNALKFKKAQEFLKMKYDLGKDKIKNIVI